MIPELKKRVFALLFAGMVAVFGAASLLYSEPSYLTTHDREAVYKVMLSNQNGGSAVMVTKDGYMLTAAHVVLNWEGKVDPTVKKYIVSNGIHIPFEVVLFDKNKDIALIKADIQDKQYVELAMQMPAQDAEVTAVGFPLGIAQVKTMGQFQGIVRNVLENEKRTDVHSLATTNIIFGNSGGGLFSNDGKLIGITIALPQAGDMFMAFPVSHLALSVKLEDLKEIMKNGLPRK